MIVGGFLANRRAAGIQPAVIYQDGSVAEDGANDGNGDKYHNTGCLYVPGDEILDYACEIINDVLEKISRSDSTTKLSDRFLFQYST